MPRMRGVPAPRRARQRSLLSASAETIAPAAACRDINYNIERSFAADVYKDGATYMRDTLVNSNHYAGPYKDPNKDLTSVQTPDPYTLVLHFQGPQPDADWLVSLYYTAPVQSDLKKLGITVNLESIPTKGYYPALRTDPGPADLGMAGWCSDWPTQAAVVPAVLGPDSSGKTWSTNNFSKYFDPTNSKKITELALSTADPATVDKQFSELANQIQTTNWPLLPIQASLNPTLVGSKIRNAGVSTIWSLPDLTRIGVAR